MPETKPISTDELLELVAGMMPEVIRLRRHLHRHPELSELERQTSAHVTSLLEQAGLKVMQGIGGYGLLVPIRANDSDDFIILRGDMDALPITDRKDCDYSSLHEGICHACGHDAHTAMLAGTAIILHRVRERLPGNVACIFQPAEESTTGAAGMLADGVLDGIRPVRMHALHVNPYLPSGSIGLKSGAICAATDIFEVTISGRGGHAARPHECTDVILIASHIIQGLNHIVSRRVNPLHPSVLTIGHIEGGSAANIIPEMIRFSGTVRSLHPEAHEEIRTRMDRIIRQTAESWGATASFNMKRVTPILENDPDTTTLVRERLQRFAPGIPVIELTEPSMGGEDFAEFLQHAPGTLLRLGTGHSPATRYPLHHPGFDIDESAMASGMLALLSVSI